MIIAITDTYYLIVAYILSGLVGLCVGSFLNVVIYRVPNGMNLAKPASHCTTCDYVLRWYDNIPIISYCILRGKCRKCGEHISFRYTAVEAANMLLWLLSMFLYKDNLIYAFCAMITSSVCLCMTFVDLEHMIIPDSFQIALAVPAIAAVFVSGDTVWYDHLIGMGAAGIVFIGLSLAVSKILGREALGGGDVKLAIVSGLLLGWQKFVIMMLIASVSGSIVMVAQKKKGEESKETPFAPFLTAGLLIAMFAGSYILDWYISLLF